MTLQEFARAHNLPPRWLRLRQQCEELVRDPSFWSRRDMQDAARTLATEASDILHQHLKTRSTRDSQCDNHPNNIVA